GLPATAAFAAEAAVPAPATAAPRSLPNPSPNGMAPVPVALAVDRAIGNALVDRPATGNYKPADLAAQPPLDPARIASTGFVADALQPVATDEPLPALSPLGEPATTPEGGETSAWLTLRPDSLAMALADRTLSRDLAAQVPLEIDQMLRSLDNRLSGMTSAAANLTSVGDMVETLGAAATTGGVQSNPAVPLQAAGQPADLPEPVALSLNAPMQQMGRWANELGDRLAWVANNRFGAATLQVNPPQLGPIEVRILMSGDQATVSFAAVQPQTREAIQQALPVLATSFASQGLSLGQASVGRDHLPQQGGQGGSTGSSGGQSGLTATAVGSVESSAGSNPTRGGNGLVDTFA
ncbi:MAG: flagellar hook-length control protein FliK, partial [Burkholderiales bacterium]|nr:flagellar hook-length control protein FliK [Burkholderiales bacterium]